MTSRDFVYWLQGYFEISKATTLDAEQVTAIRNHINLVFRHEIDPSMGPQKHQDVLSAAHTPFTPGLDQHLVRC